ncbi:MAG: hypothetical protein ACSHX8_03575 [Opitutaceae bacterium]
MSKTDTNFPFPPPLRKKKQRLTLRTAIAAAARAQSKIVKPLMDPLGEFPAVDSEKQTELLANLIELQADIIIREDLLNERAIKLKHSEREILEREALLEAHIKVAASNTLQNNQAGQTISSEEREAFEALKKELAAQEASIKETRKMLQEREEFIVQCENELVEKSMEITELEAKLEQREEDHEAKVFRDNAKAHAS